MTACGYTLGDDFVNLIFWSISLKIFISWGKKIIFYEMYIKKLNHTCTKVGLCTAIEMRPSCNLVTQYL
jgi:hypothetical protein